MEKLFPNRSESTIPLLPKIPLGMLGQREIKVQKRSQIELVKKTAKKAEDRFFASITRANRNEKIAGTTALFERLAEQWPKRKA